MEININVDKLSKSERKQLLSELIKFHPDLAETIAYNINNYGVPFLARTEGVPQEELHNRLYELVNEELRELPVEFRIYPTDSGLEHWHLEYQVLKFKDDTNYITANEYEKRKKEQQE